MNKDNLFSYESSIAPSFGEIKLTITEIEQLNNIQDSIKTFLYGCRGKELKTQLFSQMRRTFEKTDTEETYDNFYELVKRVCGEVLDDE